MTYVILTERVKCYGEPQGRVFWSHVHGMFSSLEQASKFSSFEAAQYKVRELRQSPYFIYAIKYPGRTA